MWRGVFSIIVYERGKAGLNLRGLGASQHDEKNWWLLQRRLLPRATRRDRFIVGGKIDVDGLDWGFHNLGDRYSDQGKLAFVMDVDDGCK